MNKKFWADVAERVIKTFCQTWGALLVASGINIINAASMWEQIQTALIAALVAFLMGVGGSKIGADNTAAWLPKGPDTEAGHVDTVTVVVMAAVAICVMFIGILVLDVPTR